MFLHIGENKSLDRKDIIAIFDMDSATINGTTRNFLKKMQTENKVKDVSGKLPKTMILTEDTLYLSNISSKTLKERLSRIY